MLRRAAVILGAYAAACLAASITLQSAIGLSSTVGSISTGWLPHLLSSLATTFLAPDLTLITSIFIAIFALLPTLVVILLTEIMRLRSWWIYLASASAVAIVAYSIFDSFEIVAPKSRVENKQGPGLSIREWPIVAAGLVAGAVYWRLAGRNAGSWRTE